MKRLLCLLAALLMFFSCAAAEGYQGRLVLQSDPQGAYDYLDATSQGDQEQMKKLADAMAELAAGLDIYFGWQDDGAFASISLKDTVLVDAAVWNDGERHSFVTTNLLPGYYTCLESEVDPEAGDRAWEHFTGMNWDAVASEMESSLESWLAAMPAAEEYGSFMGDAYDGGFFRRTYTFDDSDVSIAADALVAALDKHGVNDALLEDLLGARGMISSFVRWNHQLAQENRYSYVLHRVYDIANNPVGYSLIVLEADEQVMSLSLAVAGNGWRAVWGYGLNGQNYYIGAEKITDSTMGRTSLVLAAYQDPEKKGYYAAQAEVENTLMMLDCEIAQREYQQEKRWTAQVEVIDPAGLIVDSYYVLDAACQRDTWDINLSWYLPEGSGRAQTPMQNMTIKLEPAQKIEWSTDALQEIQLDGSVETAALIDELIEASMQDLMIKLIRLMPTQLLTLVLMPQ